MTVLSAMFEIDEESLPIVRTGHALLAVDLQNDFISADAKVPVSTPPNFVDNITNLAPTFRGSGNVIWIRTVFEASRPVNIDGTSESVITDTELPKARNGGDERSRMKPQPSQQPIEPFAKLTDLDALSSDELAAATAQSDDTDPISETYLTLEPGGTPHIVSRSSSGSHFPDSVNHAIDAKKDTIFQKTHYSAFRDGNLVQTLQAKFVTEIYLCGTLTNISIFATVMDAARHGYAITIIDDCLGYRSKARHDEALRKLIEFTGCETISSTDLIRDITEKKRGQRQSRLCPRRSLNEKERQTGKDNDLDTMMSGLHVRPDGSTTRQLDASGTGQVKSLATEGHESSDSPDPPEQAAEPKLTPKFPFTEDKRERVKTKFKARQRQAQSSSKDGTGGETVGSSSVEKRAGVAPSSTSVTNSRSSGKSYSIISDQEGDAQQFEKHEGKFPNITHIESSKFEVLLT